jgi:murein L,D-transpeptidase YcbB/YkuD
MVKSLIKTSAVPIQNNISDSITAKSKVVKQNQYVLSSQFSKLQQVLEKYQTIEKNNLWTKIDIDSVNFKSLKPVDNGEIVKQIRTRLFIVGDLKQDSKSDLYDEELMAGVLNYKKRHGLALNYELTREHINQMNEPISNRIKSIKLNMQRFSQMPENQANATEYIMVNIPSYRLFYIKDGKNEFVSDVFVGAKWSETEVFSSMMDKVVFSPYWNIPQSIVENEIKQKIYVDKNYLEKNDMEWNDGRVRQKPGPKNSLGLVKFMFPNPYDIYMHDTPAKSLFLLEKRTFSHGCINIKDAKGLAETILKNDTNWDVEKIENAMNCGKEIPYELKNKIPVYVGYFTAWVNDDTGEINFFDDIYEKDVYDEQLQNSTSIVVTD